MLSLAAALWLSAQPSNVWLDEARTLIAELQFTEALARLEVARQVPSNGPQTKKAILEWTAYCQLAEGRYPDAERTFMTLLELEPNATLTREVSSPKVLEAFEATRRKRFPPDYVKLSELPSPAGRAQLELVDPWKKVSRVVLHQRRDEDAWTEVRLEEGLTFPLAASIGGQFQWFVEALDAHDAVLTSVGSRAAPREVRIPSVVQEATVTPAAPSQARRIIGYVGLGLGVALGAVATGLEVSAWNQRLAARDRTRPPGDYAATALEAEQRALTQQRWAVGLFIGAGVSLGTGLVLVW